MRKKATIFTGCALLFLLCFFALREKKERLTSECQSLALSDYSYHDLIEMRAAGQDLIYWMEILQKGHSNVVAELIRHVDFYMSDHYPKGDVRSSTKESAYYYHAHRPQEHGHFHTFFYRDGEPTHIIAISMDNRGEPIGLFTTNRWVTKETWKPALEVIKALPHFDIDHSTPSWPTNRWLTHFFTLFRPQIEQLLLERDRALSSADRPLEELFQDRSLEILSASSISITEQMNAIEHEINKREIEMKN